MRESYSDLWHVQAGGRGIVGHDMSVEERTEEVKGGEQMMGRRRCGRRGQSIIEYVLVTLAVIGAIIGLQEGFRDSVAKIGDGADGAISGMAAELGKLPYEAK